MPIPLRGVLDLAALHGEPEGMMVAALVRRGWSVGFTFSNQFGYTLTYANPDKHIAGSAVSQSFAEVVKNAFTDVADLVEGT